MFERVYSLWSEIRPRHLLSRGWGSDDLQSFCFLVVTMTNDSSCSCHSARSSATEAHTL